MGDRSWFLFLRVTPLWDCHLVSVSVRNGWGTGLSRLKDRAAGTRFHWGVCQLGWPGLGRNVWSWHLPEGLCSLHCPPAPPPLLALGLLPAFSKQGCALRRVRPPTPASLHLGTCLNPLRLTPGLSRPPDPAGGRLQRSAWAVAPGGPHTMGGCKWFPRARGRPFLLRVEPASLPFWELSRNPAWGYRVVLSSPSCGFCHFLEPRRPALEA